VNITTHFRVEEFASHDGEAYPVAWIQPRLIPLCLVLETVREVFDRPMVIISGYRSPSHNAKVGGAKQSQHMEGRAADITIVNVAPADVHATILELYNAGKLPQLGGLGVYPGWVHVDIRERVPADHLAQWSGTSGGIG
jgi:uncharacterized protein YcbK (DUF882 family)